MLGEEARMPRGPQRSRKGADLREGLPGGGTRTRSFAGAHLA